MIDTDGIRRAIEDLYASEPEVGPTVDVPPALMASEFSSFARNYMTAASLLEQERPGLWLVILQLTGHAVELSLKACIASKESVPPTGHDLLDLYRQVEEFGFELDKAQYAMLVHLHHFYFQDLATQTKYKSRYPTKRTEGLGGAVPSSETFSSIVESLLDQTN